MWMCSCMMYILLANSHMLWWILHDTVNARIRCITEYYLYMYQILNIEPSPWKFLLRTVRYISLDHFGLPSCRYCLDTPKSPIRHAHVPYVPFWPAWPYTSTINVLFYTSCIAAVHSVLWCLCLFLCVVLCLAACRFICCCIFSLTETKQKESI